MKFLETKYKCDGHHIYTSIGGVQIPTKYNKKFRGILYSKYVYDIVRKDFNILNPLKQRGEIIKILIKDKKLIPIKVKDFDTFQEAHNWYIDKYIETYLVWC